MQNEDPIFTIGDAVLILGTDDDGKVGTILRRVAEQYLVALEDGTEVLLPSENLSPRR
jgi:hypothetical protein